MTKFYNLPPPWDPGYAIPKSVLSEGLERHAFVTRMMPRGTYDPEVGVPNGNTRGYAIPKYVREEGTGRGTFTTAWTPRGYYGPAIPHYLNRQPMPNIVLGDVPQVQLLSQPAATQPAPSTTGNKLAEMLGLTGRTVASNDRHYTGDLRDGGGSAPASGGDRRPGPRGAPPMDPYMTAPPPSPMSRLLPLALIGGAAFVAYRFIKGRKAAP